MIADGVYVKMYLCRQTSYITKDSEPAMNTIAD